MMEQHGLVSTQDGNMFLSSLSLATVLQLEEPVLATTRADSTAFELRHFLCLNGWETVDSPAACSVRGRRMMRVQCRGYFMQLKHFFSQTSILTDVNAFSHNQRQRYYDAIAMLCSKDPFAPGRNYAPSQI